MEKYIFLQHYWWLIISLLAAILVFMLFVQGGQSLLYRVGKTPIQRDMIVNTLGRKWSLTFTTLVTFGGAFFASFPLFYSTSFGGAYYVWMAILLVFVIQAVGYEFRSKANNLLGERTYEAFLQINGVLGALLLGVAVGTFFTGANFFVDKANLANIGGVTAISSWANPWHGLEAVLDYRNVSLGLAVMFLSRVLGAQFFINTLDSKEIAQRSQKQVLYNGIPFVLFFLLFVVSILLSDGWAVDPNSGLVAMEKYKYFNNFVQMPIVAVLFLLGVVSVLYGIYKVLFTSKKRLGIWFSGAGTVATVLGLFLVLGFNNTAYYPSLADMQSSLTIFNSSSSQFTLSVMAVVSLLVPFVIWYIWYAWREMTKTKITKSEITDNDDAY